mgnify:CR=1 FL=1
MVIWWLSEAVPIPITSLLPLPVMPLAGLLPMEDVAPSYSDPLILLFLGGFILAIALMIVMISRWKIHPFLSIMVVAFALGIIGGIPLVKSTGAEGEAPVKGIADVIGEGFSGIFTSIGIVIILGTLIGLILERTGGAFRIADALVRVVGKRYPVLAM